MKTILQYNIKLNISFTAFTAFPAAPVNRFHSRQVMISTGAVFMPLAVHRNLMRQGERFKADTGWMLQIGSLEASLEGVAGDALVTDSLDKPVAIVLSNGRLMGMMSEKAEFNRFKCSFLPSHGIGKVMPQIRGIELKGSKV